MPDSYADQYLANQITLIGNLALFSANTKLAMINMLNPSPTTQLDHYYRHQHQTQTMTDLQKKIMPCTIRIAYFQINKEYFH